jgi:hypothetical protein
MSEEVKKEAEVSKKSTWWNRIWSAVVGAAIAVGSMFGITSEQISAEKAKVETVQVKASAALEALKVGDVTTATANLKEVVATGKEVVADAKSLAEKVKAADKESVVETAKDAVTKAVVADQVKKVEAAEAAYTAEVKAAEKDTKAKKSSKKIEKASTEAKK